MILMRCLERRHCNHHVLMMQQSLRSEATHLDIRSPSPLGSFHELRYDDAQPTSRLLDLALASHGRLAGEGGVGQC